MASLVLSGDTSGSITVSAPAVAGSNTQTLPAASGTIVVGSAAVSAVGQIPFSTDGITYTPTAKIVSGTAQTAPPPTPQYFDFTGIPSWVKRITVIFDEVSTSGTSNILVQLGDSGGVETTGYLSQANTFNSAPGGTASTAGFLMLNTTVAANSYSGVVPICNPNGNDWVTSGVLVASTAAQGVSIFGGIKTLSATLDRIRITTVNGTDTFDAGTINILYE